MFKGEEQKTMPGCHALGTPTFWDEKATHKINADGLKDSRNEEC